MVQQNTLQAPTWLSRLSKHSNDVRGSRTDTFHWLFLCHANELSRLVKEQTEQGARHISVFLITQGDCNKINIQDDSTLIIDGLDQLKHWSHYKWAGVVTDETHTTLPKPVLVELMELSLRGIKIYQLEDFYSSLHKKIPPDCIKPEWLTYRFNPSLLSSRVNVIFKRGLDIALVLALAVVTSPIMVAAALLIKLDSSGSVFFRQTRTGIGQKPFQVYKFRSMYQDAERDGAQWAKTKDSRITRVGSFLRLVRIDELPQIWNVLKGEMSLIGPRPERPEFDQQLRRRIPFYDLRYTIKPGITGWAQVNYPYGASTEDAYHKLSYDIFYIQNYSLWLDLSILLKTIKVVFLGKGR